MAKILIGNIKGPQGEQGPQGVQGPVGPQGPKGDTGPMPTLINNGTTTQAGVGALDAAYGKTLADKDTDLQNQLNTLNGKTDEIEEDIAAIEEELSKIPETQVVSQQVNLDNIRKNGIYYFNNTYVPTGIPAGSNGWLVVFNAGGSSEITKQLWFRHGTANSNDFQTFVRTFSGGMWSNWKQFSVIES